MKKMWKDKPNTKETWRGHGGAGRRSPGADDPDEGPKDSDTTGDNHDGDGGSGSNDGSPRCWQPRPPGWYVTPPRDQDGETKERARPGTNNSTDLFLLDLLHKVGYAKQDERNEQTEQGHRDADEHREEESPPGRAKSGASGGCSPTQPFEAYYPPMTVATTGTATTTTTAPKRAPTVQDVRERAGRRT